MKIQLPKLFNKVELSDKIQKPSKKQRLTPQLERPKPYRVEANLEILKNAITAAQNPDNPNRFKLYTLYEQVLQDSHLASQLRTAKLSVMKSRFELRKNGKPDNEAAELLKMPWFDEFLSLALDAEFWGHSLIEFGYQNDDGQFEDAVLITRKNVKPEKGMVVADPMDDKGIAYRDKISDWFLIEVGSPTDLGLLAKAAREILIKNYARTDWSQASEKYGMPLLKITTDTTDPKEMDRLEEMAQDFASNGYVILNSNDDATIIQPPGRNFYQIYEKAILRCDENISKLINGQTGTSDEKSYVGSANVHERILNDYTFSRMRKIQYTINRQLIPFLVKHGYPLSDYSFAFPELEQVTTGANKAPQTLSLSDTDFS